MTPYLEACLSGGGRIGQVGIGRNNLLKPVRRASCKKILSNTETPEPTRARYSRAAGSFAAFLQRSAASKNAAAATRAALTRLCGISDSLGAAVNIHLREDAFHMRLGSALQFDCKIPRCQHVTEANPTEK